MSKDIQQAYTQVALKDLWPHSRWTVIASPLVSHVLPSSQQPDWKYHKLLHPSSLAAPLFSPFLKVNMSALCTSCCRSQCRDVSTALCQHLFQSSSSYPDTKTPSPPSPSHHTTHIFLLCMYIVISIPLPLIKPISVQSRTEPYKPLFTALKCFPSSFLPTGNL